MINYTSITYNRYLIYTNLIILQINYALINPRFNPQVKNKKTLFHPVHISQIKIYHLLKHQLYMEYIYV